MEGGEAFENGYIQGAGDDNETWSCGLTPQLFWQYRQRLLSATEEGLPELIRSVLSVEGAEPKTNTAALVVPITPIYIGRLDVGPSEGFDGTIICNDRDIRPNCEVFEKPGHVLHLRCGTGKLGSRALRAEMPLVPPFVSSLAACFDSPRILITCSTGNDLSVGVALALICLYFDDDCKLRFLGLAMW